tara:strand:- start:56389 stop:56739 length:351 start_codon:yes stop_codon:yes gene_type:complete
MDEHIKILLFKYQRELETLNIAPERQEDYLGMPGAQGLSDTTDAMKHIAWMIDELIKEEARDWDENEADRWLGFIQGILWFTKMRGIVDLQDETASLREQIKTDCPTLEESAEEAT